MKKYIPIPILKSISSNYSTKEFPVGFEDVLTISHISNQDVPMLSLPSYIKSIMTIAMVGSVIIGSYYKYIMYSYVWTTNRKNRGWMHRPINILIVISAVVHHFTHLGTVIPHAMIITYNDINDKNTSKADVMGNQFCQIT